MDVADRAYLKSHVPDCSKMIMDTESFVFCNMPDRNCEFWINGSVFFCSVKIHQLPCVFKNGRTLTPLNGKRINGFKIASDMLQ